MTMNAPSICLLCLLFVLLLVASASADLGCDKHKVETQCVSSTDCAWCTSCTVSCLDAADAMTLRDSVFDCVYGSGAKPVPAPAAAVVSGFGFDFFSRTNTKNVTLPTNLLEAAKLGWAMSERKDGTASVARGWA
jgi:hypothetical protein